MRPYAALVTGANRGLGLALATELLGRRPQARVALGVRRPENAAALAALRDRFADRCRPVHVDYEDEESLVRAAADCARHFGRLDLLVNCGGVNTSRGERPEAGRGPLPELSATAFETLFRTNVVGPMVLCRELLPLLTRAERPVVVNISSVRASLARVDGPGSVAYSVSKAALNMLTRKLALDPTSAGLVVVAVDPGWVRTRMGGDGAPASAADAAAAIVRTVEGLDATHSGQFLDREGERIPW